MLKSFKYRLYPNGKQKVLLSKHLGACKLIFNLALETKTTAYSSAGVNLSRYTLQEQLVDLKEEYAWLYEINAQSLQSVLMHLDIAFSRFFKGLGKFPKFKKRGDQPSFQCPQGASIKGGRLKLPKFKEGIKIVLHRPFEGKIKTVTISRTPTGKYFASILVDDNAPLPTKAPLSSETTIAADVGLKTFATLSDGREYENPKYLKRALNRLKLLQKRASKKQKGSANRKKANLAVSKLHEKIANQRKDFLHKFSHDLTKNFDTVIVENLNVAGMVKNHILAQAISDVSWSTGLNMLKYKAEWRGKTYHEIGRFDASSKIHNKCGYLHKDLTLADRTWVCPKCGGTVERDINAALNIKQFGLIHLGVEQPLKPVELPTLVVTMKQEG